MRGKRYRLWPILILVVAVTSVVIVRVLVDSYTREPPNYSRIEDRLWLGGYVIVPPQGTRAVLNLCESEDPYRAESHRWRPIPDAEPVPSLEWLSEQVAFIEAEQAAGKTVYVHCRNGVSRSAMVVTAYLMQRERWSRKQALEVVRCQRPIVRPNGAFMRLLTAWEEQAK